MPSKDPERNRQYCRDYYAKSPEQRRRTRERQLASRERNQLYVEELKSAPCADCGGRFPMPAMDYDHVGDDKERNVTVLVRSGASLATIDREIAKCELVCANCHRVRTARRAGYLS